MRYSIADRVIINDQITHARLVRATETVDRNLFKVTTRIIVSTSDLFYTVREEERESGKELMKSIRLLCGLFLLKLMVSAR